MKKTIYNKLFAKKEEKIREYNINVIKNKEYKIEHELNIWYWFYNDIDKNYYCSYCNKFYEYIKTKIRPEFFGGCILLYDEIKNITYISNDVNNYLENFLEGKIIIKNNVMYYEDTNNEFYISNKNETEFNICKDITANEPIKINEYIYEKKIKYIDILIIKYDNNYYISNIDIPSWFYKIESNKINDENYLYSVLYE